MRTLLLAGLAAIGLSLGLAATNANAAWVTRTSYRYDPACCRYIACTERVWVTDCPPCEPVVCHPVYRHPVRDFVRHVFHPCYHEPVCPPPCR